MMRHLVLGAALAWPMAAQAETAMEQQTCQDGWRALNMVLGQAGRFQVIAPFVNADGWCQIDDTVADLRKDDFDTLVWRATGVEAAIEARGFPESVEAVFTGIDVVEGFGLELSPEAVDAMGALRLRAERDAQTLDFRINEVVFDLGALGMAEFAAAGGGIDLSGLSRMQLTLGGMRVHEGRVALRTTPELSRALAPGAAQLDVMQEAVGTLPGEILSEESRRALKAFLAAPDQNGQLEIEMTSENGLGAVQIIGGAMRFDDAAPDMSAQASGIAQMLSGVEIMARWTPAR